MMHEVNKNLTRAGRKNRPAFCLRVMGIVMVLLATGPFVYAETAEQSDTGTILMHDNASCDGTSVRLGDVAELTGKAASFADMVIAAFPAQSQSMTISIEQIRKTLDDAKSNQGRISVRGYAQCKVQRMAAVTAAVPETHAVEKAVAESPRIENAVASSTTLREQLSVLLENHANARRPDLRITFSQADARILDQDVTGMRLEFEPIAAAAIGRVPMVVRGYRENKPQETWRITADVAKKTTVVTAARPLSRGQVITAADVNLRVQDVYLSDFRGQPLDELSKVIGKTAQTTIRPGQTICADHVRAAILVKRNEPVLVRCVAGGLVVTVNGRAAEDGVMNQTIQITNESTHATLSGKITGPNEAIVQLSEMNTLPASPNEKGAS